MKLDQILGVKGLRMTKEKILDFVIQDRVTNIKESCVPSTEGCHGNCGGGWDIEQCKYQSAMHKLKLLLIKGVGVCVCVFLFQGLLVC